MFFIIYFCSAILHKTIYIIPIMKKNDFEFKLREVSDIVRGLILEDSVNSHSALYAFLVSADASLYNAICHLDEFISE